MSKQQREAAIFGAQAMAKALRDEPMEEDEVIVAAAALGRNIMETIVAKARRGEIVTPLT